MPVAEKHAGLSIVRFPEGIGTACGREHLLMRLEGDARVCGEGHGVGAGLPGVIQGNADLANAFATLPASAALQVWWHWINGNVTKEGVTADLEATHRVGIGGVPIVNIGDVPVIAQARLHGENLGIRWKPPFSVEVTGAVQAGTNTLEVTVANLRVNRLIGNEQLPPDAPWHKNWRGFGESYDNWPRWLLDGKPGPTGHLAVSTWRLWFKDDALKLSGLLGPVTLRATAVKPVFQQNATISSLYPKVYEQSVSWRLLSLARWPGLGQFLRSL